MAPPMARLTKCGAASENGRRANRESKPSVSHRASGRASDNRRRKPGADTPALSSAPRREPSRSKASSSAFDSGKGPESSSVDRRPKGPNRDAEPNAGASSGSCGRSSERWATRKSRRVRTGAGGSHSLRWRDVRIRSGTGRIQRWMRATHQRFVHGSVHPRRESGSQQRTLQSILPRGRHRADVEAPKRPVYVRSVLPRNVASPAKRQIAGQKFAFSQMLGRERAARDDDGERESASLYGPVRDTRDTANVRVFVGFGNTVPLGSYLPYIRPSRLRARPRRDGCHPLPSASAAAPRAETAKRDFFRGVVSRRFARRALALRLFPRAPRGACALCSRRSPRA